MRGKEREREGGGVAYFGNFSSSDHMHTYTASPHLPSLFYIKKDCVDLVCCVNFEAGGQRECCLRGGMDLGLGFTYSHNHNLRVGGNPEFFLVSTVQWAMQFSTDITIINTIPIPW